MGSTRLYLSSDITGKGVSGGGLGEQAGGGVNVGDVDLRIMFEN